METPIWVLCIGFLAQAFFSARILTQWILSERARTVLSPSIFWVFSIGGSYLLCLYGWLRQDFSIVLGQFVAYYIYLWNLKAKGLWDRLPRWLCLLLMATPIAAILFVCGHAAEFVSDSCFSLVASSISGGIPIGMVPRCFLPDSGGRA
jgi:lipid-A-disaccharide synthase-like uncharacterized protein